MKRTLWSFAVLMLVCLASLSICGQQAYGQARGGGGIGGGTAAGGGAAGLGTNPGGQVEQIQQGAGTVDGSERFGRANRDPGAFVGADTSDTQNFFSQQNGAARNNQNARNTNRNNQNTGTQQSRTPSLRRRMHVGFKYPTIAPTQVSENLNAEYGRISSPSFPVKVQVAMRGRTAILRGSVASLDESALAVALAKLEPGVSQVQNELSVGSSPASSSLNGSGPAQTTQPVTVAEPMEQGVEELLQQAAP